MVEASVVTRLVSGIHCESYGDAGDWIVLVQGLGGHAGFWNAQIEVLSRQARVLVYDHAGVGRSEAAGARGLIAEMAVDLLDVLDTFGIERAHVVGHSMGGLIAQEFSIGHSSRVKSLAIGGSFAFASVYLRLLLEFRRDVLQNLGPAAYCRFLTLSTVPRELFLKRPGEVLEKEARAVRSLSDVSVVVQRIEAILKFDRRNELACLSMPVLIVAAEDDTFVPWQDSKDLAERFSAAEFKLLGTGGHFFPQFAITEYSDVLRKFVMAGITR